MFSAAIMLFGVFAMMSPVTQAAPPNDFKGLKIVIDPGHGGHDGGAVAPNGLQEKFINLSVAKYLAFYLRQAGATVKMTRSSDVFIPLARRADIANKFKAHRFVSVHQNSAPNKGANGTETYYNKPQAARLSKFVQNELIKYFGHKNRGSRHASFAVIRKTSMPAVLTEASFISQPKEAANMVNGTYRQRQALAIYRALQGDLGVTPKIAKPVAAVKATSAPVPVPTPAPIPVPAVPEKPLKPAKLQVQMSGKFGIVNNKDVKSDLHIPYVTANDNLVSIRNVGGELTKPKVVFSDVLGNKVYEIEPFLGANNSYSFYASNLVGKDFIGSIDIIQPIGQISSGLSAGVLE